MPDYLAPGDMPAPHIDDKIKDFPAFFAAQMWSHLWPQLLGSYANAADRDAELAGLGPSDRVFAFVEDSRTLWRWTGATWALAAPWEQSGTIGLGSVAAGGSLSGDLSIAFPLEFPSATWVPSLEVSFQAAPCRLTIVSRAKTGMQVRVNNYTSSASASGATVYWSATLTP